MEKHNTDMSCLIHLSFANESHSLVRFSLKLFTKRAILLASNVWRHKMAVSYKKLWELLIDRKKSVVELRKAAEIAHKHHDKAVEG